MTSLGHMLTHDEARRFYDWFGAKQDLQRIYEDPAIEVLLARGDFAAATAVVELGCGTGRFAERLLRTHLPPHATDLGLDISETMVELARAREAVGRAGAGPQERRLVAARPARSQLRPIPRDLRARPAERG